MIYEFIATISAGFALAGIALIIRHLSKLILKKQPPKWIIPLFAFIGIMGFQIHQEYNWSAQMQTKIPKGVQVVKTVDESIWYRPWTYVNLKRTNLYLFARRMSSQVIPQAFDCANGKRADIIDNQELVWMDIEKTDKLYMTVCE